MASFLIFSALFFLLLFTDSLVLFLSSFVLILARGIYLFVTLSAIEQRNYRRAEQANSADRDDPGPVGSWPVFLSAVGLQLLPIGLVIADFYILFYRREWWSNLL